MDTRDPPIATLPREPAHQLLPTRSRRRGQPSWQVAALPAGFARKARLLERRLGWLLWGALAALVVVLSD